MPEYDVRERHERFIPAAPALALELALRAPIAPDPVVGGLLRLRGLARSGTIEQLAGKLRLAERERTPTCWVVVGGATIRIGMDFVARAADGGSLLSTETRVQAAAPLARRLFRLYWLAIGPFSPLVPRRWLRAV